MTIAITIRTGSAVVFAADSKVTTFGVVGYDENGQAQTQQQTYDNGIKIARDRSGSLMAMFAGEVSLGPANAVEFISRCKYGLGLFGQTHEEGLFEVVRSLNHERSQFWNEVGVPADRWPSTVMLLATTSENDRQSRTWRVSWDGATCSADEMLTIPGIWLEGSFAQAFSLLYGYDMDESRAKPIDRLNLWSIRFRTLLTSPSFSRTFRLKWIGFSPGCRRAAVR